MSSNHKMRDIAEKLSLSRSTVSSVLNDKWREKNISAATAERVLEYVEKIGYAPNLASVTLKGKVSKDLLIILPLDCLERQKNAFFDIASILATDGVKFMILPYASDTFSEIIQSISAYRISKVLIISGSLKFSDYKNFLNLAARNPHVEYFLYDFRKELMFDEDVIVPKNVSGIGLSYIECHKIVFSYIAERGFRRLLLSADILEEPELTRHLRSLGLETSASLTFAYPQDRSKTLVEKGAEIADKLLEFEIVEFPVAVYIADDLMTLGAIQCLLTRSRRVPEEFAFISWDGLYESEFFSIPITTLSMPHDIMIENLKSWLNQNSCEKGLRYALPTVREGESL